MKAKWGAEPEFFGPRHAHREGRILDALERARPASGPHLECAAGVGSLSAAIAHSGVTVVAADMSIRSLHVLSRRVGSGVLPVAADITRLPFQDASFASATSAETLEHIPDDALAVQELSRVLLPGAALVGTVPAGPEQWSDWDVWADHQRRYDRAGLVRLLETAGFRPHVKIWGWPVLRVYDDLFLKKVNRRRLKHEGAISQDSSLAAVHTLGKRRVLVALVRRAFSFDRLFDGVRWGVGLLFVARKPPKLTP